MNKNQKFEPITGDRGITLFRLEGNPGFIGSFELLEKASLHPFKYNKILQFLTHDSKLCEILKGETFWLCREYRVNSTSSSGVFPIEDDGYLFDYERLCERARAFNNPLPTNKKNGPSTSVLVRDHTGLHDVFTPMGYLRLHVPKYSSAYKYELLLTFNKLKEPVSCVVGYSDKSIGENTLLPLEGLKAEKVGEENNV